MMTIAILYTIAALMAWAIVAGGTKPDTPKKG
jgi:hypothetical protein